MEGVETSLDRTLQPDFHNEEGVTTTTTATTMTSSMEVNVCSTDGQAKPKVEEAFSTDSKPDSEVVSKVQNDNSCERDGECVDRRKAAIHSTCDDPLTSNTVTADGSRISDETGKNGNFANSSNEPEKSSSDQPGKNVEEMDTSATSLSLQAEETLNNSATCAGSDVKVGGDNVCQLPEKKMKSQFDEMPSSDRLPLAKDDGIQQHGVMNDNDVASRDLCTTPVRPAQASAVKSGVRLKPSEKEEEGEPNDSHGKGSGRVSPNLSSNEKALIIDESEASVMLHDQEVSQPVMTFSLHASEQNERADTTRRKSYGDREKVSEIGESRGKETASVETREPSNSEGGETQQVESLSCQESIEDEVEAGNNSKMVATMKEQPVSPPIPIDTATTSVAGGQVHVHAAAVERGESAKHEPSEHSQETESSTSQVALASSSAPDFHPSSYSAHQPWFSLYPRNVCESVQVAYINNQAVLVDSSGISHHPHQQQQLQQAQQQQQQVQHVLATDAAGHQYIMATPTPTATASTVTAAPAAATHQYAYVTPDGQIIAAAPAAGGQNQVIQQVTGMSYALVGNTLVQVPQTQYIAVNAAGGQQLVIAGGGQPSTNQQAAGAAGQTVQYVAVNAGGGGGSNAASANFAAAIQATAAATGQQTGQGYVAVVEREGGGQMLVQVGGSAEQQVQSVAAAASNSPSTQQYIVQTTRDPTQMSSLVATTATPQTEQVSGVSSNEATPSAAVATSQSQTRYGIVNSDGSITLIDEETAASYNAALAGGISNPPKMAITTHTPVSDDSVAIDATVQQSSGEGGSGRSLRGGDEGVKVEIEVPDQYPQVYVKTEEEEEEEEQGEEFDKSGQSLVSGQSAVVVVDDPAAAISQGGAGQSSLSLDNGEAVSIKEDVQIQGSGSVESMESTNSDGTNQQVTAAQVYKTNYRNKT